MLLRCFWGILRCPWSVSKALKCVWDVFEVSLRCQTCVCCLLYSCMLPCMMYDVYLSINATKLDVASIWVICSLLLMIPKLIQDPSDQAQHKWLVLPQCTWGQCNPLPLSNTYIALFWYSVQLHVACFVACMASDGLVFFFISCNDLVAP